MKKIYPDYKVQKFEDGWAVTFFSNATGKRIKSAYSGYKMKCLAENALETLRFNEQERINRLYKVQNK